MSTSTLIRETRLESGKKVFCLSKSEARLLEGTVQNYLKSGIKIKPGDTVFDIGANIGLFTLLLADKFDNQIKIYSFEPIPDVYQVLKDNVERLNSQNIKSFPYGLSKKPGNIKFNYYPTMSFGSTIYPPDQQEIDKLQEISLQNLKHFPVPICWLAYLPKFLSSRILNYKFTTGFQGKEVNCQVTTISEIIREHQIEQIDFLKIDVEKAEMDVILGIETEDWPKIKQIFIEIHDIDFRLQKITKLLREKGFENIKVEQEAELTGTDIFGLYAW